MKSMTLREARDAKRWSQERLSEETKRVSPNGEGIPQAHISKIERGDVEDPMNSTVVLLETALDLKRGTLVFGQRSEAMAS